MSNWLKDWQKDKQKRNKAAVQDPNTNKVDFKQASMANNLQYTLPGFTGRSGNKGITSQWERDLLGSVKGMGRSYDARFNNLTKSLGMNESQAMGFRTYMDAQEASKQQYKLKKEGTPDNRHTVYQGQGIQLKNNVIDGIINDMNNPNSYQNRLTNAMNTIQKQQELAQKKAKQSGNDNKKHSWMFDHVLNPVNNAVGNASDWLFRAGESGVNDLTAGQFKKHINDASAKKALGPAAQSVMSDNAQKATTLGQKSADVVGSLYATAPLFMGLGKVVDPLAKAVTASKYGQAAIRGGLSMGALSGAQNAVDATVNHDPNLKHRAADVALNSAIGAGAEMGLTALGPIAKRIFGKLASGKSVEQVAKEEGMKPEDITKLYDYTGRTFNHGTNGQIIDANAPRLNAPPQQEPLGLNGPTQTQPQLGVTNGLPEPLYKKTVQGLGQDVQVKGTPQLNAPKTNGRPIQNEHELNQTLNMINDLAAQQQARRSAYVDEALAPFHETAQQQAAAQAKYDSVVKIAKDEAAKIKDTHGKIYVPKNERQDYQVPPQFRASLNDKHAIDIHEFATREGFATTDEAVQYLQSLDQSTKVKLKDMMPADNMKVKSHEWTALEDAAKKSYHDTQDAKTIDNLITQLTNHVTEYAHNHGGNPLQFKTEKRFKVTQEPVSYTGNMNPKDMSTVRSEGSYATQQVDSPSGDTLKIKNTTPQETPLQFKTQKEFTPFKTAVEKQVKRGAVEADGRIQPQQENANNSQVKPETSTNAKPVGITPGGAAHVNDISWVDDPKSLKQKIQEGDINLKGTVQKAKHETISDLQFFKDMMRTVLKKDMGQTLQTIRGGKDITYSDNLFKGLKGVRLSISKAMQSAKEDYGPILKYLKTNKISPRDFNEYASAVHFSDVLVHNHDKMVRAGEVSDRLAEIEKLMQGTNDKTVLKTLSDEERALLKEKDTLEPYILPKEATPEKIQRVLDRWKNTPAMEQARLAFMQSQRKDLAMQVQSGLLSKESMDAMIKAHPNYVFMGRNKEMGDVFGGSGNISKPKQHIVGRKGGSEENLKYNPLESAIRSRILTFHNVTRNDAMQSIERIAQAKGGSDFFQPLDINTATDTQKQYSVKFFKDGKAQFYEVPPVLKQAFDNLDRRAADDMVAKIIQASSHVIRKGATHMNLDFIVKSPFKETNSLITSRTGMHPGNLVMGYLDSFFGKGIEKLGAKSYKDIYEQLGGHQAGYVTTDPQSVKSFLRSMNKGTLGKGMDIVNPFHWIGKIGQAVEHGPKLAEFRSAKGKGLDNLDAMHEAVDVIDYTDLGKTTRFINQYVPFIGPMIRGTSRYFQAAAENPAAWAAKNLMYITAPTVAIYASRFAPWATDEQRSKINNMNEWQKNLFWAIPKMDGKGLWMIPKMHVGAQIFANPVERVLDNIYNQNPKTAKQIIKSTGKDLGNALTPPSDVAMVQLIKDSQANYNRLMDMPIEDMAMQKQPYKTKHYNSFTSEVAKQLGKATGQSPAKLDYVLKGMTAGTGRDVLDTIDNVVAGTTGKRPSKVDTTLDILNPLTQLSYKDTSGTGTSGKLYNQQLKDGPKSQAASLYGSIREINKKIKNIEESKKLTPAEKKQQIAELRKQQRAFGDQAISSGLLKNQ